ncbi:MAG: ATP-dependent Clp protease proteolytic subunit [Deferribacterales bacterium]
MHFDPITLFWLFLIIISLQPALRQKMLENARLKLIETIEKKRGSRVILLVHRQEKMSFLGFPLMRYIDIDDSEEVLRAIHMTDENVPIDLIVHTPGGLAIAATQIARALSKHKAKVTVFIPHYAMSGGTLIALSADEIVMSKHAVIGPLDPQLGQYPAVSILNTVNKKPLSDIDDNTLILADQAERAVNQMKKTVSEILKNNPNNYTEEQIDIIINSFVTGKWTHDYPISSEEAKELGLNVKTDIMNEILLLMNLYPQPVKQTVEYLPIKKSVK